MKTRVPVSKLMRQGLASLLTCSLLRPACYLSPVGSSQHYYFLINPTLLTPAPSRLL